MDSAVLWGRNLGLAANVRASGVGKKAGRVGIIDGLVEETKGFGSVMLRETLEGEERAGAFAEGGVGVKRGGVLELLKRVLAGIEVDDAAAGRHTLQWKAQAECLSADSGSGGEALGVERLHIRAVEIIGFEAAPCAQCE
jgi:hypothetical protein